jgi:hypothetical protein
MKKNLFLGKKINFKIEEGDEFYLYNISDLIKQCIIQLPSPLCKKKKIINNN